MDLTLTVTPQQSLHYETLIHSLCVVTNDPIIVTFDEVHNRVKAVVDRKEVLYIENEALEAYYYEIFNDYRNKLKAEHEEIIKTIKSF